MDHLPNFSILRNSDHRLQGTNQKDIISKDYYPQLSLKHIQAALSYSSYLLRNEETRSFATI